MPPKAIRITSSKPKLKLPKQGNEVKKMNISVYVRVRPVTQETKRVPLKISKEGIKIKKNPKQNSSNNSK
jgi:hypothetical protein